MASKISIVIFIIIKNSILSDRFAQEIEQEKNATLAAENKALKILSDKQQTDFIDLKMRAGILEKELQLRKEFKEELKQGVTDANNLSKEWLTTGVDLSSKSTAHQQQQVAAHCCVCYYSSISARIQSVS